jgi:hypothetical protein
MNRADLDRCIGELYPLLTRNVDWVAPAGIPGVHRVSLAERFRIIATVNDATLDDIVFPISEGLARRFVRIGMKGALLDDVIEFIGTADEARSTAARLTLNDFHAACETENMLTDTDTVPRLPFGVGYFALLRSWVMGELVLPRALLDLSLRDQALHVLRASLAPLSRDRGFLRLLEAM